MAAAERRKTFCFDLDGTLCTSTWGEYERAEPFPWAIERVNALAAAGHTIVIFTARGTTTGIDWRAHTEAQLERWGVRYDELMLGKPQADVYVDDRTVHVDAWRYGDALDVPHTSTAEAGGEMPALPPPRSGTVIEIGRTFGGEPLWIAEHAQRLCTTADRYGVPRFHSEVQVAEALRSVLTPAVELRPAGDDVLFTLALAGPPHAAYLDTVEDGLGANLTIGCRLVSQAAAGLRRYVRGGGVVATTDPARHSQERWPLRREASGTLRDMFGGELVAARAGELRTRGHADPPVALARLEELAAGLGLTVAEQGDAGWADELLLVDIPFCVLPLAAVDEQRLDAPGPVTEALAVAWRELTGVDPATFWFPG